MRIHLLFFSLCVGLHLSAQPSATGDLEQRVDRLMQEYLDLNWFSGVVVIAEGGKPVYQKGFGYADQEKGLANTPDAKFRIGSINKLFTAILVMQQIERGKLSFDDRLEKFGLGFPAATAKKITLRHILSHTAGFPDLFTPEYLDNLRSYRDINDILPLLREAPLLFEPGAEESYSNYGYIVLGAILEKVTGKQYEALLAEDILRPLGLNDIHYDIAENLQGVAHSYRFWPTGEKSDFTSQLEYPTPDGGMYSTAADLLTFFQAFLYTDQLLQPEHKLLWFSNFQEPESSWKEFLASDGLFGEAGGGPGVSAVVVQFLSANKTILVLANVDEPVGESLARRLVDVVMGQPYQKPELPLSNRLYQLYREKGRAEMIAQFPKMIEEEDGPPPVMHLNRLGYQLLELDKVDEAIDIFAANVQLFPDNANVYDSLGEAYYRKGDKEKAVESYRKALELDPEFPSALEMLRKLEE